MPQVEIVEEHEHGAGWRFAAQVLDDEGVLRRHDVALAWVDYNLWSPSGADEPARVAAAVVAFLLERIAPADVPARFDASLARRRFADADQRIPRLV